jgi:hypothetical protein
MTQYLLSVHFVDTSGYSEEELHGYFEATGRFNDKLRAEGSWVFAGGLQPIEASTMVDGRGSEVVVTDGPFVESKEYLAGFWVIEAPDLDAALKLAGEASRACGEAVEIRPFQGDTDE